MGKWQLKNQQHKCSSIRLKLSLAGERQQYVFNHFVSGSASSRYYKKVTSNNVIILFFPLFHVQKNKKIKTTHYKNSLPLVLPQTTLRQNSADNILQIPRLARRSQARQVPLANLLPCQACSEAMSLQLLEDWICCNLCRCMTEVLKPTVHD